MTAPRPTDAPDEGTDFDLLLGRMGRLHLQQRLVRQVDHVSRVLAPGLTRFHIENLGATYRVLRLVLLAAGLYRRGRRNALAPVVRHHTVRVQRLPAAFRGHRVLHLSDLHGDINTGIVTAAIEHLRDETYDTCVLTGDYRSLTSGPFDLALGELLRLRAALRAPVYAVLGNHDFIEMVQPMERAGIRVLLNESVLLRRDDAVLGLAGIDDPHVYQADNMEKAAQDLPPDAPSILLTHSPESYAKAEACGFDLLLCGHTHGGQICLPGGIPLVLNANCPRAYCGGPWRYKGLQGYTSRGTGCCGLDVRFNCPAEIVIHHLEPA